MKVVRAKRKTNVCVIGVAGLPIYLTVVPESDPRPSIGDEMEKELKEAH